MNRDDGWILKGGTNLYCRIPGARHTRDLDLYRQHDPTAYLQAAADLIETMHGATIGPYRFTVTAPEHETVNGTIDSINLTVEVFHGVSPILVFGIDVSGDLRVPEVTDTVTVERSDQVELEFMDRDYIIRSYPIENQVADKVSAMYELHGHRRQASTRYRDLYDIALIALELEIDATRLADALRIQAQIRGLILPRELYLPNAKWVEGYTKLTRTMPQPREEIIDVDDALRIAGALTDPVLLSLEDTVAGTWSPRTGHWI